MSELNLDKSNWKTVTFGDVVAEVRTTTKDPIADGIERVVGLEHIESECIHLRNWASIEDETTFTKVFRKGHVLFGRRRAYLKKAAVADFDGICSGDITVLKAKSGLLPELLPFLVNNDKFFDYAVQHSAGGLSPRTKFKDLANYKFRLPPEDQQAAIGQLLMLAHEGVERTVALEKKAITFAHVSAINLLGLDGYGKVSEWHEKKLKEIAPLQRGFDLTNSQLKEGTYPVCYSNGVQNYHSEFMLHPPGVVTGRSGTIGNVFFLEKPYWPHNTTLWVTSFCGNDPKFVFHLYRKLRIDRVMAGTGVPTLNRNDVHELKAKIPDLDEQIRIAALIDRLEESTSLLKEQKFRCMQLLKYLINQIF